MGFSATSSIFPPFEKSVASLMKILRFGKTGTVYRKVDHVPLKIVFLKFVTFLKVHICPGTLSQMAISESKHDLGNVRVQFSFLLSCCFGT